MYSWGMYLYIVESSTAGLYFVQGVFMYSWGRYIYIVESSTAGLSVVQLVKSCTAEVGIFI